MLRCENVVYNTSEFSCPFMSTPYQISKLDAVTTLKWINTDKIMDICRKKSPHTKDKHNIVCLKFNIVNVGVSTMITRRSRWICEKSRIYILHIMKFMWPSGWCLRPRCRIIKKNYPKPPDEITMYCFTMYLYFDTLRLEQSDGDFADLILWMKVSYFIFF